MLLHHHKDHHQPSARRPHLHLPLVALLVMVACHHQQLVAAQSQPQPQPQPQVQPQAQPQPQSQLQQEAAATQAEPLPRPESLAEPPEPAAVIKFVGMQHGHPDDERAKEELIKGLGLITKHAIKLDAMEAGNRVDRSFDVAWHSERLAECAERPLEELLATIKNPATREFTREFKMFLGENFKPPASIEVEWRADCQNLARKRSQVPGDEPARATAADERQQQPSSTSSLFPSASRALGGDAPFAGSTEEDADKTPQAATEAAASSTASTTTTVEPSAPSSTAEPQPTTPDFLSSSSEPTTTTAEEPPSGAGELAGEAAPAGATSGLDASPKSDPFGDEFFNGSPSLFGDSNSTTSNYENIAGPLNTSILDAPPSSGANSTTTAPSLLLLSNETATTESTSASSLESVASSPEPSVTTTTTTAADLSSAGPENSTAPAELDATTTTPATTTTTTTAQSGVKVEASSDSPGENTTMAPMLISDELVEQAPPSRIWARQLEATAPAPKSAAAGAPEPHYGKYVGLTTAFLIFCAYLVCARAYRRQGMYELHESSSSLATRT